MIKLNFFCSKFISVEKCDIEESVEMQVCLRPFCERCADFETPCVGVNEKCVDTNGSKICLCKEPFKRDEYGDCQICNATRPFPLQCKTGNYFLIDFKI